MRFELRNVPTPLLSGGTQLIAVGRTTEVDASRMLARVRVLWRKAAVASLGLVGGVAMQFGLKLMFPRSAAQRLTLDRISRKANPPG
jgi:hypothetical protein